MKHFLAGIDIGSTTVKLVLSDESGNIIWGEYRRHMAKTKETLSELLCEAKSIFGSFSITPAITGSGAINLSRALGIEFVQEVVAVASALEKVAPETDVAIELGGEDAKIIYFTGGLEERMNGVCAGGTGSFIDQMASLLQTDAAGLNEEAKSYTKLYPIASRCGVFAKTDIQPLINEGAKRSDLAASIFAAVVNQTVSGLACGKPIRGKVAFLGGPLHFLTELKAAFVRGLGLTPETTIDPENSHLFAALGAAITASGEPISVDELIARLGEDINVTYEMPRLDPLFEDEDDYERFVSRHMRAKVERAELESYTGGCFLGIDAGSTTTKMTLIGEAGELLWSFYENNRGDPIETAKSGIAKLAAIMPKGARILRACSTGYGEALFKSAFSLDEGEVETIAHTEAAAFFDPKVDCVLDIGGQDMKCIKLAGGAVESILLNEACSSGCGSFIENFANSLGYNAADFAREAILSRTPVDLGTRCTVFMNSNVKQAQKEGASVSDISAGLAYSVVKNALFKVIKLTTASELGSHIVVQGGTFYNHAVLRAFEKIAGVDAVCPDISGLMGAFGAALIAKKHYTGAPTSMLSLYEISALTYTQKNIRCKGCQNSCMLTVNTFSGGRRYITGNKCEKGAGNELASKRAPDMFEYKLSRIFAYESLPKENAPRGVIGIPRVLNMYENYPFWATLFGKLGFSVVLSPLSSKDIYKLGMESIPSESECYPAKLSHGHIEWLIKHGVKTIFHPCVFFEKKEHSALQNNYNCPMVISYSENLKNNVESVARGDIRYLRPFVALTNEKVISDRLVEFFEKEFDVSARETREAVHAAWAEQERAKADIRARGKEILAELKATGGSGIVLCGRPYHVDPEINHGIPSLIASYGLAVLTEDSLPIDFTPARPIRVLDQWVYHSRLYTAAEFVREHDELELIQLVSFGCGLDAVTSDQVNEILSASGKLYTMLKIDEIANLGAVGIRIRSLISAVALRKEQNKCASPVPVDYKRTEYTKDMQKSGYTILAPQMSPIHFDILEAAFRRHGYNVVILDNDDRSAIDTGLRFVNNDACYPSITVVGQLMQAVLSGKYDTDRLALMMTQTGGCCRASNYVGFIRRALESVGLSHIPVISLSVGGLEKNSGFSLSPALIRDAARSIVLGDLLMRCLYRTRPYEKIAGSANAQKKLWSDRCADFISGKSKEYTYSELCEGIVADFDALALDESVKKPRVGVVGEILVKYMPLANNHVVDLLESEGAEAVVPDMIDFFCYSVFGNQYRARHLGIKKSAALVSKTLVSLIGAVRAPAVRALEKSRRFDTPVSIYELAELTKPFLSVGNQYGEGWFLAGEMIELIRSGTPNIVCIQPFACLPNHVVGKGVIGAIKKEYPEANIAAVDYDPGASEVNQLNRIKLMLSVAKKNNMEKIYK